MRHSKAVHMLEAGVELIYIRDFLGHASIQTTEIYATVSSALVNKTIRERQIPDLSDKQLPEAETNRGIPDFLKRK